MKFFPAPNRVDRLFLRAVIILSVHMVVCILLHAGVQLT